MKTTYSLSSTGITAYIYAVEASLWKTHTTKEASALLSPLTYWVGTGRIPTSTLKGLLALRPSDIANALSLGGSVEECISRMRRKAERKASTLAA